MLEAYATNLAVNDVLLDALDPSVWRANPPCSKRRNIATTFAHMHNVRCMRLKMSAKDAPTPERLDRAEVTNEEARKALRASGQAMLRLIERSCGSDGRVPGFTPGVAVLVAWAIAHDAHHRGQICHWAAQLGKPLSQDAQLKMWEWDKRWKDAARDGKKGLTAK